MTGNRNFTRGGDDKRAQWRGQQRKGLPERILGLFVFMLFNFYFCQHFFETSSKSEDIQDSSSWVNNLEKDLSFIQTPTRRSSWILSVFLATLKATKPKGTSSASCPQTLGVRPPTFASGTLNISIHNYSTLYLLGTLRMECCWSATALPPTTNHPEFKFLPLLHPSSSTVFSAESMNRQLRILWIWGNLLLDRHITRLTHHQTRMFFSLRKHPKTLSL